MCDTTRESYISTTGDPKISTLIPYIKLITVM